MIYLLQTNQMGLDALNDTSELHNYIVDVVAQHGLLIRVDVITPNGYQFINTLCFLSKNYNCAFTFKDLIIKEIKKPKPFNNKKVFKD